MSNDFEGEVDERGRLVLPEALAEKYHLKPGTRVRLEDNMNGVHLRRPVSHLARIYIEPTNRCNLECVTCMRHSWNEPLEEMDSGVFTQIIKGIQALPTKVSEFRRRVQEFNFSPCILCGGCDLFESNQEDCIGSPVPTCGGCLWAQGIIRCP